MQGTLAGTQNIITTKIWTPKFYAVGSPGKHQVPCHSSTENTLRAAYKVIKLPDLTVQY